MSNQLKIINKNNIRRDIAEFVLNCSTDELFAVLCALESDDTIPEFFSCDKCKELFGECTAEETPLTELCKNHMLKYEETEATV